MLRDGDQISTLETFQHFIILDLLWLPCSSIVKGRTGVEADGILDKYQITDSALPHLLLALSLSNLRATTRER